MAYNPNNPNGSAVSASSAPVVIASDQSTIPAGGNIAAGATDSGNPLKVGGKYNSTLPTLASGQRGDIQLDASSRVIVSQPTANQLLTQVNQPTASNLNATVVIATGSATIGKVQSVPNTGGGNTSAQLISAASTNATSLKASAGTLFGIQCYNTGAAVAFLKIYNKASAPTVGTDTPVKTIGIPAGGGTNITFTDIGDAFGTGIAYAITGLNTVADTTAVALAQVTVNIDYA